MWRQSALLVVAAVALIAGCDGGDDDGDGTSAPGAPERGAANGRPTEPTAETRCQVGRPPDYFVPKPEKSPLATIGCARLGVSSKPVEFSANSERIGRRGHVCLNPAYGDRGRRGLYIPAACVRAPVSRRLDVVSVEVPSQGVRGYGLVIWGTAAASTRTVTADYEDEKTEAAVFRVNRRLARATGATRPYSVFVLELRPEVDCPRVLLRAADASRSTTTRACEKA